MCRSLTLLSGLRPALQQTITQLHEELADPQVYEQWATIVDRDAVSITAIALSQWFADRRTSKDKR